MCHGLVRCLHAAPPCNGPDTVGDESSWLSSQVPRMESESGHRDCPEVRRELSEGGPGSGRGARPWKRLYGGCWRRPGWCGCNARDWREGTGAGATQYGQPATAAGGSGRAGQCPRIEISLSSMFPGRDLRAHGLARLQEAQESRMESKASRAAARQERMFSSGSRAPHLVARAGYDCGVPL